MYRSLRWLSGLTLLLLSLPVLAKLQVFACEPEWAALTAELGGDRVATYSATTALQDPHHIEARPSLIAKVRRADLLVCSGAELETGWLPLLQRQAGNRKVLPDQPGYFEASGFVQRLEIPQQVDRSQGDIHASGNPHVHLDPHRLLRIAEALSSRLQTLDPPGASYYAQRQRAFTRNWHEKIQHWEQQAASLRGMRVVVHHRDWSYLFDWLGIVTAGTLEPRPGLPTSPGHLSELKEKLAADPAKMIIHTAYQSDRAARRLSQLTGIPVVELPYTVGGSEQADSLSGLFDITLERLLRATQ
jgi:zinc/manganese transport system substrate-binding protein